MPIMNYKTDTTKGMYQLVNSQKYRSPRPPIYKSGWELKLFVTFDTNPFIEAWGYEPIEIYYYHPIYQKWSVYYPDFFIVKKSQSGRLQPTLIEVKPDKFTKPPKQPKPPTKGSIQAAERYQRSLARYQANQNDFAINCAKWQAAQSWCLKNSVEWCIISEKNVSGFFKQAI